MKGYISQSLKKANAFWEEKKTRKLESMLTLLRDIIHLFAR